MDCQVFLFVRKVVLPFKVLVSSLILHSGASFAQMDSVAHQHSVSQSAPLQPYRMPQGINSQGAIEESVSSGEFERFIAVPLPQESLSRAVVNNPSPLPSVQTASPFEPANSPLTQISPNLPPESIRYIPWWQNRCASPLFAAAPEFVCRVDLEQLIWQSMQHSPGVQSILIVPQIQRTEQQIAQGEFDPRRFGQSNYHNTSDPIGNTLTTGGPPRLNEDFWENSVGIRDRNVLGGKTELAQLLNAKNNNSLFFKPNNQADAKLSLNYTQPLMRGSGKFYNTSSIQIASIRTQASIAEANRKLQDHVLNIVSAYWDLTLYRNLLVQSQNGQLRLQQIKQQLETRTGRDLLPAHVSRAHAAIQAQQGQIANAIYNIKKQEAILRSLVNSPEMEGGQCREIIPLTSPEVGIPDVPIEEELYAAIFYRGDIVALQQAIENAVVQRQLAVNELRPTLDLIAGGYVHGLRGNNQIAEAWGNQFTGTSIYRFCRME